MKTALEAPSRKTCEMTGNKMRKLGNDIQQMSVSVGAVSLEATGEQ